MITNKFINNKKKYCNVLHGSEHTKRIVASIVINQGLNSILKSSVLGINIDNRILSFLQLGDLFIASKYGYRVNS